MAGRDARFERPPCMREICGGTCNVRRDCVTFAKGRSSRASLQANQRQDTTPNVVAMAVRTVMRICRTLLQMVDFVVSISFS